MTEVIRNEKVAGTSDFADIAETFSNELSKFSQNLLYFMLHIETCWSYGLIFNS